MSSIYTILGRICSRSLVWREATKQALRDLFSLLEAVLKPGFVDFRALLSQFSILSRGVIYELILPLAREWKSGQNGSDRIDRKRCSDKAVRKLPFCIRWSVIDHLRDARTNC